MSKYCEAGSHCYLKTELLVLVYNNGYETEKAKEEMEVYDAVCGREGKQRCQCDDKPVIWL